MKSKHSHPAESTQNRDQLLKVEQVAPLLNKSKTAIYRMVGRDQIPFLKMGRSIRFDPEQLREWLAGLEGASTEEALQRVKGQDE